MSLEIFYRHRQLGLTLALDVATRLAGSWGQAVADDEMSFVKAADEQACQVQASALVQAYLKHISLDAPQALAVESELEAPLVDPFTGEDSEVPLVGVMKLVLPEEDGPMIVDFKRTARGGERLEMAQEDQLSCYAC